jgi:hypothetical protein
MAEDSARVRMRAYRRMKKEIALDSQGEILCSAQRLPSFLYEEDDVAGISDTHFFRPPVIGIRHLETSWFLS